MRSCPLLGKKNKQINMINSIVRVSLYAYSCFYDIISITETSILKHYESVYLVPLIN